MEIRSRMNIPLGLKILRIIFLLRPVSRLYVASIQHSARNLFRCQEFPSSPMTHINLHTPGLSGEKLPVRPLQNSFLLRETQYEPTSTQNNGNRISKLDVILVVFLLEVLMSVNADTCFTVRPSTGAILRSFFPEAPDFIYLGFSTTRLSPPFRVSRRHHYRHSTNNSNDDDDDDDDHHSTVHSSSRTTLNRLSDNSSSILYLAKRASNQRYLQSKHRPSTTESISIDKRKKEKQSRAKQKALYYPICTQVYQS
jgi:hypothetical protein